MGCRIYVLRAAGTDLGIHYGLGAAFKNVTGLLLVRVLVQVDGKIRLHEGMTSRDQIVAGLCEELRGWQTLKT